jgi:hypothetical protein
VIFDGNEDFIKYKDIVLDVYQKLHQRETSTYCQHLYEKKVGVSLEGSILSVTDLNSSVLWGQT